MATDILLDPSTHDIDLTKGISLISNDLDALGQKVKIALLLRTTEWAPNINKGVPYHDEFFRGKSIKSYIDSFYQDYILDIEGVSGITSYTSTLNNERQLEINVSITSETGQGTDVILEV